MLLIYLQVFLIQCLSCLDALDSNIRRPENFFGSDSLLDGYFDDAEYYVNVFTLRPDVTIEVTPDEIPQALNAVVNEGIHV